MNDVKCSTSISVVRLLLALSSLVAFYLRRTESNTSSTRTTTLSKLNFNYDVIADGASKSSNQQCTVTEFYRSLFILSNPREGKNQCSLFNPEIAFQTYHMSMSTAEHRVAGEDAMETNVQNEDQAKKAPSSTSENDAIPNGSDDSEKNSKKPAKRSNEKIAPITRSKAALSKNNNEFGNTLEDFGYKFDEHGVLRDKETNEGFVFVVGKGYSQSYYQRRYEALGAVVTEHVYHLLETDCNLKRHYLPIGAQETDARSFIFASEDFYSNEDCLLILIHGSGAVRAGQWARSIIINKSIDEGTQIPYVKEAQNRGWAVLVLNTNLNFAPKTDANGIQGMEEVHGSATPFEHAAYVWDQFVLESKAKTIFIVAHSAGGLVTAQLADKFQEDFADRVRSVGLTDSVHALKYMDLNKQVEEFYEKNVINWVSAPTPLDTEVKRHLHSGRDCKQRSAGTPKHELTSHCAKNSIFKWFSQTYSDINSADNMNTSADDDTKDEAESAAAQDQLMESVDESEPVQENPEGAESPPDEAPHSPPAPHDEMNSY